jgi:capsular exopolysaccharide synthesis family protein
VLGAAGHFVLLFTYPIFTAQVIWECFPQEREIGLPPEQTTRDELEKFMATQAQIMMSTAIIDQAVVHPDVQRNAPEWYQKHTGSGGFDQVAAGRELEKRVRASIMGETQLIRLSFWATDAKHAAAIASIVAQTYQNDRWARVSSEQAKRRDLLALSIQDIEKRIKDTQEERFDLISEYKVESLDEQINISQGMITLLTERLVEANSGIEAYSSQLNRLKAQLDSPTGIVYDDAMRMAADRDPVVQQIRSEINLFKAELDGLRERLGPNHLSYKSVQTRLRGKEEAYKAEYERALRRQFDAMIENLSSEIAALQAQVVDLVKKREDAERRGTELARIRAEINDLTEEITQLNERKAKSADELANLQALKGLDTAYRIRLLQNAKIPNIVTFPKLYVMVPAGIVLVVGLLAGLIALVEIVDQRVKGPSDIAMISRTKVVGIIPHSSEDPAAPARVETVFRDQPSGVLAESYRQARASVVKQLAQRELKSLLVVSGMPASGSTTVVVNLAYALAAAEHRVLVIDANFRRPTISKTLGLQDSPGLADVLVGGQSLAAAVQPTDNPNVSVLAAGSSQHRKVERLATPAMSKLLRDADQAYDVVLIDAAPAIVAGDAIALANRCDATLLVVRAMAEKRGMVARLRTELGECRAEFIGVLINGVRSASGGYLRGNIRATHEYQNGNA